MYQPYFPVLIVEYYMQSLFQLNFTCYQEYIFGHKSYLHTVE